MKEQIRRVWARITEGDFRDIKTEASFLQMPLQDLLGKLICNEVDRFNRKHLYKEKIFKNRKGKR